MNVIRRCLGVALVAFFVTPGMARVARRDDKGEEVDEADQIADQVAGDDAGAAFAAPAAVPSHPSVSLADVTKARGHRARAEPVTAKATTDAQKASAAFSTAKTAAEDATKVAKHSVHLAEHAQSALKRAHDAVHVARVDTAGLSKEQKQELRVAEAKLKEATKTAEYGQIKNAKYVEAKVDNKKLQEMEAKMRAMKKKEAMEKKEKKKARDDELEAMREEIERLRKEVEKREGKKSEDDETLKELEEQIKQMEEAEAKEDKVDKKSHDEMKAEIERLRQQIAEMEDDQDAKTVTYKVPETEVKKEEKEEKEEAKYEVKEMKSEKAEVEEEAIDKREATPIQEKGIDIDTAMPYGDLEPFGREDTAQELTEDSIKQSDEMVDQLERAEVSEEKRAVFRALTRLRGAAITSFDGVARSQTGNIDEYNKIHKWRSTHPLHHLADEESDVSKWAFPDNADF